MPDVSEDKLQAASHDTYGLDYPGGMRLATGLNLDPNGICRALYGKELNECFTELLGDGSLGSGGLLNSHALLLDGSSGCWCTTPDAAALDIVGDIDLRAEGIPTGSAGTSQTFISKWDATGNQRSYILQLSNVGLYRILWTTAGATTIADTGNSQAAVGSIGALRKTLDVVDGTNRTIKSYYGDNLDDLAAEFSSESPAGTTSIFAGTAVLGIGAQGAAGASDRFIGRITRAQVRNGIGGTIVANPDFRNLAPGTTSFVDSAGLTWTLQGTAKIV